MSELSCKETSVAAKSPDRRRSCTEPSKLLNIFCIVCSLVISLPNSEASQPRTPAEEARRNASTTIWRDPGDISALNLIYGPGGKKHEPTGKFTFLREDKAGTSPKFDILDEEGTRWRAKLGEEAQPETAATRLLWAAGYYADEDYYLPELRVEEMPKLSRGGQYISADGVIRGVRLERKEKGTKKVANWSWFRNPFTGTKELNGLKIMMALVNNWDLKEENNAIYEERGEERRYVVSDVGASFGRTGNSLTRSKNNWKDYQGTKFIQHAEPDFVDFVLSSRPFILTAVDAPNHATRTHMEGIVKHIPRPDAKWLGGLLGRLSSEQIEDCFRAAGYSPAEVEGFTSVVQQRIAELNAL